MRERPSNLVSCVAGNAPATSPSSSAVLHTSTPSFRARTRFGTAVLALLLLAAVVPASAQTDEIEEAKRAREQTRAEAAEVAADLDPLLAEDAELEAAVRDLELHVATQQAKLDGIQQSLASSRAEAAVAADRVLDLQLEIGAIRGALIARAVDAYTTPDDQRIDTLFTSVDVTVAAHKRALLDTITSNEVDLIDQLRGGEALLEDLRAEADAAVARVEDEEAAETEQLAQLESALEDEQRLKAALEARIAEVRAEIDALNAEEAGITALITSLIAEEEERIRAEEEARRLAAERERLAREAAERAANPEIPLPAPPPPPPTSGDLIWPSGGVVTSSFGPRWGRMHNGIDIAASSGTPVVAVKAGTVIQARAYGGYGNMVIIDHGSGFTTLYGHLTDIFVTAGQSVSQGTQVGTMGCTGSCTGPHVHFETRVNGSAQDPMLYL